ncbi:MAG: hypothetical protein J3R72DRAFT_443789 [Linnemannia gamsii]|nr:MAG: hypothetical protein J3R72DRAFT_443789 [Linnemannia gamsii]
MSAPFSLFITCFIFSLQPFPFAQRSHHTFSPSSSTPLHQLASLHSRSFHQLLFLPWLCTRCRLATLFIPTNKVVRI